VAGAELSEWHSGYRAYSVEALRALPFDRNSNGFSFDTEVIVQLLEAGKRIVEIPIPTYYGEEISHVNGMSYAWDITRHVTRYRLHKMGFGSGELAFASSAYEDKPGEDSSHGAVVDRLAGTPRRVLDLGCGDGHLGARLRAAGHHVTGIDLHDQPGPADRLDAYLRADLEHGLPEELGTFDVVLAADVFEHLARPEVLLADLRHHLAPGGVVLASIPNFAHWYPRLRVVTGRFDYDRRGILDRTHLRFFTRRSFERLAADTGWRARVVATTGLPFDVADRAASGAAGPGSKPRSGRGLARRLDRAGVGLWPSLFAYQYLFELAPVRTVT
jgi:2-polyprenyl-3-methyl-5-hydroxy-6-metoxy-1,4-benzoquinol methylase